MVNLILIVTPEYQSSPMKTSDRHGILGELVLGLEVIEHGHRVSLHLHHHHRDPSDHIATHH